MQTTCRLHNQIFKMLFVIPIYISHNVKHLGPTNGMFNAHTHPRDSAILGFLFCRQLTTPRFLLGLIGLDSPWFISLKAGVFPQLAAHRETEACLISQLLVMFLPLAGRTQAFDLLGALVTDDEVFHRVALLLAAVVPLYSR